MKYWLNTKDNTFTLVADLSHDVVRFEEGMDGTQTVSISGTVRKPYFKGYTYATKDTPCYADFAHQPEYVEVLDEASLMPSVIRYNGIFKPQYTAKPYPRRFPEIKDVIYNPKATIVFWGDGTKTVVKLSENDTYDPEKGLAMAIAKKALGNEGNYYNKLKKWLPKETPKNENPMTYEKKDLKDLVQEVFDRMGKGFNNLYDQV